MKTWLALVQGRYRAAEGDRDGNSSSFGMRSLLREPLPEVHPALRTCHFLFVTFFCEYQCINLGQGYVSTRSRAVVVIAGSFLGAF